MQVLGGPPSVIGGNFGSQVANASRLDNQNFKDSQMSAMQKDSIYASQLGDSFYN